ncbi:MAG: hypothetical protein ABS904_07670, partial [Solibacillus isronensis]
MPQPQSGSGRSRSGASLNPSPRYSEASDFLSQKSTYDWISIAQPTANFYPANVKKTLPEERLRDGSVY